MRKSTVMIMLASQHTLGDSIYSALALEVKCGCNSLFWLSSA